MEVVSIRVIDLITIWVILILVLAVMNALAQAFDRSSELTEEDKRQLALMRAEEEARDKERIAKMLSEPFPIIDIAINLFLAILVLTAWFYVFTRV